MVMVPVLEGEAVLAATVYWTVPFPDPLLPEVTVIQVMLLVAVQAHPEGAVTLTLPVPPEAAKGALVGLIE